MPLQYLSIRDSCYERKRKNGKLSKQAEQECKKMASIWYFKKYGKTPQQAEADLEKENLPDAIDIEILDEQLSYFGNLEEYNSWRDNISGDIDG